MAHQSSPALTEMSRTTTGELERDVHMNGGNIGSHHGHHSSMFSRATTASELAAAETGMSTWGSDVLKPGQPTPACGSEDTFTLQGCPGFINGLDTVIRRPNVGEDDPGASISKCKDAIIRKVNHHGCAATRCLLGKLVPVGLIQFLDHNGRTEAVGAGRWICGFRRANWARAIPLNENRIIYGNVTIVSIQKKKFGLAWDNGREVLLGEGIHVYNDPAFVFERIVEQSNEHIHHGTFHIVRVPRGKLAKVWASAGAVGLQPRLLSEGMHVIDSPNFTYEGLSSAMEQHIGHGSLHLMRVPKGYCTKIIDDGRPQLLGQGYHLFESPTFQYIGVSSLSDKLITHGTMSLLKVGKGEVAVAWLNNEPMLIENPGYYSFDDPTFAFVRHQPVNDKIIALGAKKIVNVGKGEVALSNNHGILEQLPPGRHILEDAAQTIDGFLPAQSNQNVSHRNNLLTVLLERQPKKKMCCCSVMNLPRPANSSIAPGIAQPVCWIE